MPVLSVKPVAGFGAGESLVAAKSAAVQFGCAACCVEADFKGSSSVHRSPSPRQVGIRLQVLDPPMVSAVSHFTRRQEAAKEHQRNTANLGFAFFRPKERRAGCPCFP
jgi:hypothetical protein